MYIHNLSQPLGPTPQPVTPDIPPAPMPNPAIPQQPIVGPLQILLVQSEVQCSPAQLATIQNIVGPGIVITPDTIRMAIQTAHNRVFADLTDTAMPPRQSLSGLRSLLTQERFRAAFGKSPNEFPWKGARWDLGRIVAARLHGARKTMFSSSLRISCFGWPWPGGGIDRPMDYMVKSLPKQERVALGALFWRSFAQGNLVDQGAALLIAGLVIRYGLSYRFNASPFRNIHCYVKYGLLMLQHPIPQWVEDKCSSSSI